MRLTWLADVLRDAGLKVYEEPGWQTRETRYGFEPVGLICHHTASGPATSDAAVRRLLVVGRPDLPGPLSQLGLRRDGTFDVIAAGRCNHNGYGTWGNDSIGIEAYNDGKGEPYTQAQYNAYVTGAAAICRRMKWAPDTRILGHKESDPDRKVDPTFDMKAFRLRVSRSLVLATTDRPVPPTTTLEEPKMAALIVRRSKPTQALFECGGHLFVAHDKAVTTTGDTYSVNDDVWIDLTKHLPLHD
jgi:hypothetical protein